MGRRFDKVERALRAQAEKFGLNKELLERKISAGKKRKPYQDLTVAGKRLEQMYYLRRRIGVVEDELRKHVSQERLSELIEMAGFFDTLHHLRPIREKKRKGKI